jgi:hypothetical protein
LKLTLRGRVYEPDDVCLVVTQPVLQNGSFSVKVGEKKGKNAKHKENMGQKEHLRFPNSGKVYCTRLYIDHDVLSIERILKHRDIAALFRKKKPHTGKRVGAAEQTHQSTQYAGQRPTGFVV